jgi:predicted transcriptional regulator
MAQREDAERRAAGALEQEVLAALWAAGAALTPAAVRADLDADLAYTTVHTILNRLHIKGQVTRVQAGRGWAYSPATDEATHTADQMRALLDGRSDAPAVLARFVGRLREQDGELLQQLLRELDR